MRFSIVIPTCARPDRLARCLECVTAQAVESGDCEIIVTDDSPDDASRKRVALDFPQVRWTQGSRRGPAANRNHGASEARGEWLLFLDDDCEAQPGWLEAIRGLLGGDAIPGVMPGGDAIPGVKPPGIEVIEGQTVCPGQTDHPLEEQVENLAGGNYWSCNLAVRRERFNQLGRFDEDFLEPAGEDMEFAWRIRQAGVQTCFCPAALVFHPPRFIGWRGIWRRTWMIRWMALYRLKTGTSTGLVPDLILNHLRTTLHFFTRFDAARWRTRCFQEAWKWMTFPVVIPYMVYWDRRFKK